MFRDGALLGGTEDDDDSFGATIPSPISRPKPDMDDTSPPPLNPRRNEQTIAFDEQVSPIQASMSMTNSTLTHEQDDESHPDDEVDDDDDTAQLSDQSAAARFQQQQQQQEPQVEDPEAESIALARMLMEQEAIESYGALSEDYLRYNSHLFSPEDLAALQAAMEDDEGEDSEGSYEQPFSYDVMLRLGESIGDVKKERWKLMSQSEIDKLPTFTFDPKDVEGKDENDCDVKCLVCQFAYEEKDKLCRLPCGHAFHTDCVSQWLKDNDICPYCRQTIVD